LVIRGSVPLHLYLRHCHRTKFWLPAHKCVSD
jgi:hypothetical protein